MADDVKRILTVVDDTPLAADVIEHAAFHAKNMDYSIEIFHIENNKKKHKQLHENLTKLGEQAKTKYQIDYKITIKTGDIYTSISEYANETKPALAMMGTHGLKGMQKVFGSKALKVIVGSSVPFFIIQQGTKPKDIKNIILPIDYTFESKEKLKYVLLLWYFYKFTVQILNPNIKDPLIRNKVKNNMIHVDKLLKEKEIPFEVIIGADKGDIGDTVNNLAGNLNADLIIITTTKHISWNDYIFGAPEQKVIPNVHRIPVICVNPRKDLTKFSSFR